MVLVTRTLKTSGMSEAAVDEAMSPLLKSVNPSIGIYARADGIHVRFAAKAPDEHEARYLIEPLEEQARSILGPVIWGTDDDTFEKVTGEILAERGMTLAAMESCTGGLFADTITNVPGSSRYFRGSIVSYATEVKGLMGVDPAIIAEHGVISDETAIAMAHSVRHRLQADVGIGITGVAGPDPQDGHPVGEVHIAVVIHEEEPLVISYTMPQARDQVKRRAVSQALNLLRRSLGP
jgi:nicotinamide-nucleotide amidase